MAAASYGRLVVAPPCHMAPSLYGAFLTWQVVALEELVAPLEGVGLRVQLQKSAVPVLATFVEEEARELRLDISLQTMGHTGLLAAQHVRWPHPAHRLLRAHLRTPSSRAPSLRAHPLCVHRCGGCTRRCRRCSRWCSR